MYKFVYKRPEGTKEQASISVKWLRVDWREGVGDVTENIGGD